MTHPPGYVNPDFPHHLCRLKKSIYGLRQASRDWYLELTSFLIELGFHKSLADPSMFYYKRDGIISYFLVYVDDIVLTGSDDAFVQHIISALSKKFFIKDLGMLHHFIGIEVISTAKGLFYLSMLTFKISSPSSKWMVLNQLPHPSTLLNRCPKLMVHLVSILPHTANWWVLYNIFPSLARMYLLLSTNCPNTCMLPLSSISKP